MRHENAAADGRKRTSGWRYRRTWKWWASELARKGGAEERGLQSFNIGTLTLKQLIRAFNSAWLRCSTGLGTPETHGPKLATLRVGDAVKVSGKINQDQNGQLVNLEECELRE